MRVLAIAGAAALGGCAWITPRLDAGERSTLQAFSPHQRELVDVPFFPQQAHECGPAALATVLVDAGIDADPEGIVPQTYLPGRQGSLQVELAAAARRHGALAYPVAPGLPAILKEIAAGNPVLVLQNLSLPIWPLWHYAVVVGYDVDRAEIVLRSGRRKRERMTFATFDSTWARGGRWGLVVLQAGHIPAGADERSYLRAALALEQTGPADAARRAYRAALERWPDSLGAAIGLGNVEFAAGAFERAEEVLRRAVERHPDAAAAWNNLAEVLAARDRFREAIESARRAVELGGPFADTARGTLASIEARAAQDAKHP